jgi:hypothetical protein
MRVLGLDPKLSHGKCNHESRTQHVVQLVVCIEGFCHLPWTRQTAVALAATQCHQVIGRCGVEIALQHTVAVHTVTNTTVCAGSTSPLEQLLYVVVCLDGDARGQHVCLGSAVDTMVLIGSS